MFWGWAHAILTTDLNLHPVLHDIQELNRMAIESSELDFTKVSMATYLEPVVQERYRLISSGAALGRGCGPLIVAREEWSAERRQPLRLAVPGRNTTACRLARMALGSLIEEELELRYDRIMPAVVAGEVDAGVIIHESRFEYQTFALKCAFDLGEWWEKETGLPLPLGLMVARRSLDERVVEEAESNLGKSIAQAWDVLKQSRETAQNRSLWAYLKENAIELRESTIRSHIDLYVNSFSSQLGEEGRAAIAEFERRALTPD